MNGPLQPLGPAHAARTVLHHQPALGAPRSGHPLQLLPPPDAELSQEAGAERRRTRLWALGESLHCSIIGTCLSTAELRQVLRRANVPGVDAVSEHELHCLGVMAASRRESGARLLQKALDRRHASAVAGFARATDPAMLRSMLQEGDRSRDIPAA